jgi:branched-chain amino acid transport system permease protein
MTIRTVVRRAAVLALAVLGAVLGPALLGQAAATAHVATTAGGEVELRGTLNDPEGAPVPGVVITATAEDGFSGTATSGADGAWAIPLPGPGTYEVLLDESTLPEDLGLRDPDRNPLSINVLSSSKTVQFPLGEEEAASSVLLSRSTQLLIDGLVFGLILALSGVGLSLIFGTTGLTNFAHGDLMTFGALSALVLNNYVGLPFLVAAALALVLSAAFGWAQDAGLWRPLRRRGTGLIAMLVVSIGFGILLRYSYLFLFGGSTVSYAQYAGQAGLEIGPISITPKSLMASAIAIVALVTTILWLQRSRMGKASRAISDNPALASASGIDVEQVISRIWIIGTTLAALGGIIYSLSNGVTWIQGFQILLLVFAGVVVGGLGTIWGALVGCLLVGVLIQLSTLVVPPELKNLGALVVLILVLLVRPQGILGRAERIG